MSIEEVAKDLTELCRAGQYQAAIEKYYAPNIVSVESMGPNPVMEGLPAVMGKLQWWAENVEVHGTEISGPYVNPNTNTFAVGFHHEAVR